MQMSRSKVKVIRVCISVYDPKNLYAKYEQCSSRGLRLMNLTSRVDAAVDARVNIEGRRWTNRQMDGKLDS